MTTYDKIYINGQWIASEGTSTISVFDSLTEQVMATIPEGTAGDVARPHLNRGAPFQKKSVPST
jgi:acyl-CoA reductase-like NAD-dependent aldehyde dehydrogenase